MRLDSTHLKSVFDGMAQNGLLRYSRMLSGYIPSPSALTEITTFVTKLKSLNPELLYLLDPVMGELNRGFYVDEDCLPLYKQLVGMATIICPNQFEAQQLADITINSLSSLNTAIAKLHQSGVPNVVITSVDLSPEVRRKMQGDVKDEEMILVGSTINSKPWFITFTEFQGYYVGVGDLFAALALGRYDSNDIRASSAGEGDAVETTLSRAVAKAIASVQGVLRKTAAAIDKTASIPEDISDPAQIRVETMRRRELRIIQSRQEIENPQDVYKARWL